MQMARYRTRIARDKLAKYRHDPDMTDWQKADQVRESPEQYYQPAVELLDTILKRHHRH